MVSVSKKRRNGESSSSTTSWTVCDWLWMRWKSLAFSSRTIIPRFVLLLYNHFEPHLVEAFADIFVSPLGSFTYPDARKGSPTFRTHSDRVPARVQGPLERRRCTKSSRERERVCTSWQPAIVRWKKLVNLDIVNIHPQLLRRPRSTLQQRVHPHRSRRLARTTSYHWYHRNTFRSRHLAVSHVWRGRTKIGTKEVDTLLWGRQRFNVSCRNQRLRSMFGRR